jgi:type I site-specific restriction endonuclease
MAAKGRGMTPEQKARVSIDTLLQQAGWHVCNTADVNLKRAPALWQSTLAKAFSR